MAERKYSRDMEKQIVLDYQSGMTLQEVADKYGFKTGKSISDKLKKHGVEIRSANIRVEELKDKVISMLEDGVPQRDIASKLSLSRNTVGKIKRDFFGKDESKSHKVILTEDEEVEMVKRYLDGESAEQLAKEYGYSTKESVYNKIKKHGYESRTGRESLMLNKEYDLFSLKEIDNEFKAYFVGLMISDGYIGSDNQLGLDMTDEDVIEFVANMISKPYNSLKEREGRKQRFRFVLNNKRVIKELERYGVTKRKSKIMKGFYLNDDEIKYYPYIIRGMIDGDGWIRKDGKEFFICTASEHLANWIKSVLEDRLFMKDINVSFGGSGIYQVRTGNQRNLEILKVLVYDKPFGMSRKYNILYG